MDWYKTLNLEKRFAVKECFPLLLGVDFESLGKLFSFRERMDIFHNKMKMEGFDV